MSLATKEFKDFIDLDAKKKCLEKEVEEIKKQMAKVQDDLIENLQINEMTSIKIAGKNCYIKNMTFAIVTNKADCINILKAGGYDDYVSENFNKQSISKLVRDQIAQHGKLPDRFGDVITAGSRSSLAVKAG